MDGWGGMVVVRRVAGTVGWPECVGFETDGAQHFRGHVLGRWKTRFSSADIHVSGRAAEPLRHAGPRPLAKKRRPCAAAVGTTRAVRVVFTLVAHVLAIVDFGNLAQ